MVILRVHEAYLPSPLAPYESLRHPLVIRSFFTYLKNEQFLYVIAVIHNGLGLCAAAHTRVLPRMSMCLNAWVACSTLSQRCLLHEIGDNALPWEVHSWLFTNLFNDDVT